MELKKMEYDLTVCKVEAITDIDMTADFFFIGKTDEEMSLVCKTHDTPKNTTERDDGWKGFRIQGVLDFSLIGILSKLTGILAENNIGIFAVSTFNTDYILVKAENFEKALSVLSAEGYTIQTKFKRNYFALFREITARFREMGYALQDHHEIE